MSKIQAGLEGSAEMVVGRGDLASFAGNIGAEVLSTHLVVLLMEQAARKATEGSLAEGKIAVGTLVNIRHFAATPLGAKVGAEAKLRKVKGGKLIFDVVVRDEYEKLSQGEIHHFIVSVDKFLEGVNKKKVLRA